jgi:hypothetical protein
MTAGVAGAGSVKRHPTAGGLPISAARGAPLASRSDMTSDMIERIEPQAARVHLASSNALLVCAYDSPEKCRANHLDDAVSLAELEARASQLSRSQEIIFYCA